MTLVQPRSWGGVTAWAATFEEIDSLATWSEQRIGRGEDAAPTHIYHLPARRGLAAVYDGLGGAGAATVCHREDGTPVTEAYLASRVTRLVVERWFRSKLNEPPDANGGHLKGDGELEGPTENDRLVEALREGLRGIPNPVRSRVAGSLRKQMPTTLASVEYVIESDNVISLVSRWAGDSRVYLLRPNTGLHQLTLDHTGETDALRLLLSNPPMSNVISADRPFWIQEARHSVEVPALLICVTDGYFGYVQSPAHFEMMILEAIGDSQNAAECTLLLSKSVAAITGDDASLVLVAIGFSDWRHVQASTRLRAEFVNARYIEPMHSVQNNITDYVGVRQAAWEEYRTSYEALLPEPLQRASSVREETEK